MFSSSSFSDKGVEGGASFSLVSLSELKRRQVAAGLRLTKTVNNRRVKSNEMKKWSI